MAVREFEPNRAVEVIFTRADLPKVYGSGYCMGGGLVLTAKHLLSDGGADCVGADCTVRWFKQSAGEGFEKDKINAPAKVVWQAPDRDIALVELGELRPNSVEPIALGRLPQGKNGEEIEFKISGYPRWGVVEGVAERLNFRGTINRGDSAFWLRIKEELSSEYSSEQPRSEWEGMSGAAVVCDGLVVGVQTRHQRPQQPNHVEAAPLWEIAADPQWRRLLENHGINPELETVSLPAAKQSLDIDWHEASLKILKQQLQLTTNPMTRAHDVESAIDQVYVPLGLVERKKVPRQKGDVSPERGFELYAEDREVEITQKFEYEAFLEQVLHQGQNLKSQGKRVAIIGEPGSGKTMLLQQMARWLWEQFPDAVVIWVSLADLGQMGLKRYVDERWLQAIVEAAGQAEVSAEVKAAFIGQCQQGKVWLILDGLDEMSVASDPLAEGGWLDEIRCVLSCRLNLWTGRPLVGFDVYRTLEFAYPQQVEQFVRQWFQSQGEADGGQTLCAALKQPGKERIRDLVKNPLRLTLLCFDWGLRQGQLPETQAGLYERYVEHHYQWKAKEFPTTAEQQQKLNQALARLSFAAIDDPDERGKGRFRLRHRFVQEYLEGQFDLALQLGWLNQVGVDADNPTQAIYAFYHTTFQEYFAALAVADWDDFLPREHRRRPINNKSYRIFESQWKQVFLLWMGREGKEFKPDKEALIQALMTFKDGCGGFYCDRAFLLAAAGSAEFKDCPRADEIVDRLMQWQFGNSNGLKQWWGDRFNSARVAGRRNLATNAFSSVDLHRAIWALMRLLKSTQDEDTRSKTAECLGKIGTGNEMAIRALVQLLESTQDRITRWSAARSLGIIDPGNETAIRALVRLLKSTQDDNTRWSAAESLGSNGTGNETAIRILARSLRHSLSSVEAYQLMTTCAEKLPYPEFYQIFHTSR
ncbi:MAG: NACHT domain-containing protein [Cyanobacteria bacterium CRU_2_1]|nr:NACHT domain-containing protein [Cyanobacteria bacterium CRU_2_1]